MNKLIQKIIPLYGILPLLCAFGLNMIVYSGAMSICAGWKHYDLTTSLDRWYPGGCIFILDVICSGW